MQLQRLIPFLALASYVDLGLAQESCGCTAGSDSAAILSGCKAECANHFTNISGRVACQDKCSEWLGSHGCSVPHRRSFPHRRSEDDADWSTDKPEVHLDEREVDIDEREIHVLVTRDRNSCINGCRNSFAGPNRWCRGTRLSIITNGA